MTVSINVSIAVILCLSGLCLPLCQMHNLQQLEEAPQAAQRHQVHLGPTMEVLLRVQEEVFV